MKQGGNITHFFSSPSKETKWIELNPYICENVRNPQILAKYFLYLLNIKVIVCPKQLMS
jgi:hypothetical protein